MMIFQNMSIIKVYSKILLMLQLFFKKVVLGQHLKMHIGKWMLNLFKFLLLQEILSFLIKNIIYKINLKEI